MSLTSFPEAREEPRLTTCICRARLGKGKANFQNLFRSAMLQCGSKYVDDRRIYSFFLFLKSCL